MPTIVTGDIQAGIEKHIAEQVAAGDGYFTVPFEGNDLKLKLVRVHVEYLASLAPQRHFACVDMASADGQFYDIDFFLEGDLMRARALYDHVVDNMLYQKCGDGWGEGNAMRACDALSGNCTDYHAYFIGLARSIGIPARFAIGAAIPSERDDGGTDGYHCWAEFYAEGKWWPVDISEGDKFSALSMYYFGHHPANRIEFTRGRDLALDPGPAAGPINFLAYPYLEVQGRPQRVSTLFLFRRTSCCAADHTAAAN